MKFGRSPFNDIAALLQGCRKNAVKRTTTAENRTMAARLHCGYFTRSHFVLWHSCAVDDVLKPPGSLLLTVLRRRFWCNSAYLMFLE